MRHRINYCKRGSKYSLPIPVDSSDSTFEADIDDYNCNYQSRSYIDPWDLENYDYVRRQLNLCSDRVSMANLTSGTQLMSSNNVYLSSANNNQTNNECPTCYAGMDEQTFYNAKYETVVDDDTTPYCSYTDYDSGGSDSNRSPLITERNNSSCRTSPISSLMLHTPGFGPAASNRRRLTLPKPAPSLVFPAPPPYDYCVSPLSCVACPPFISYIPENNYCTLSSNCCECLSNGFENISLYAPATEDAGNGVDYGGGKSSLYSYSTYSTTKFGLSKKGLLQIDYSCNWNDLDRLIGTKGL